MTDNLNELYNMMKIVLFHNVSINIFLNSRWYEEGAAEIIDNRHTNMKA